MTNLNQTNVLNWFTGKARANAFEALNLLAQSVDQGYWVPGAARKVRAALDKTSVTKSIAKQYGAGLEGINNDYKLPRNVRGWAVAHILQFGLFTQADQVDINAISAAAPPELRHVVARAQSYLDDFAPIASALRTLDATRPQPVFTYLGASPTVTRLLVDLGLVSGEALTCDFSLCPIEWKLVDGVNGKRHFVGELKWPPGTVHQSSRYAYGTARNRQCHACGHAIKNPFNWVPLVVNAPGASPRSLFVGVDCARTLFGIKVTGDIELTVGVEEARG